MSYYHVTTIDRIPSIESQGLRPFGVEKRFKDCPDGVYLATDPIVPISFMFEKYYGSELPPKALIESIRIIVVDKSRLDDSLLFLDDNVPEHCDGWKMFWCYDGTVDIRGMPILTVDQICGKTVIKPTSHYVHQWR
jgi:hypothetical protein